MEEIDMQNNIMCNYTLLGTKVPLFTPTLLLELSQRVRIL